MRLPVIALLGCLPITAFAQQQQQQYTPTIQVLAAQAATCEQLATNQFQKLSADLATAKQLAETEKEAAKKLADADLAAIKTQLDAANQKIAQLGQEAPK